MGGACHSVTESVLSGQVFKKRDSSDALNLACQILVINFMWQLHLQCRLLCVALLTSWDSTHKHPPKPASLHDQNNLLMTHAGGQLHLCIVLVKSSAAKVCLCSSDQGFFLVCYCCFFVFCFLWGFLP